MLRVPFISPDRGARLAVAIGAIAASPFAAHAQPVPDASMPSPSIVEPIAPGQYRITGGTAIETNLFHSFSQFDLGAGEVATFDFDAAIANAIVRVTGGRASQIDGAIVSEAGANLIFANPQGWLFGGGAQLDVGGAIAFSSADAVVFADGSVFPAVASPTNEALLSVAVPVGLQLGSEAGGIRVGGSGHDLTVENPLLSPIERNGATDGLRGAPANLLMLAGGEVAIDGGTVTAASGLLSIVAGRDGFVPLGATIDTDFSSTSSNFQFGDITLGNEALLDVTGPVSGRIDLIGDRVALSGGSILLAQQFDDRVPDFPGAGINVLGETSVLVTGIAADGRIQTRINSSALQGERRGGDIAIRTPELTISQGASIVSRTYGAGRGGDLVIDAQSVQILDVNDFVPDYFSSLAATGLGTGRTGDLNVTVDRLFVRDGGALTSATFGLGAGGNIRVAARDRIDLVGVETRQFNPSTIIASSFGSGDAGDVDIRAPEIALRLGGRIDASTFSAGDAGVATVRADRLTMTGTMPLAQDSSAILSSANILDPTLRALLGISDARPSGDAGGVQIFVDRLEMQGGATVAVRNQGSGDGGQLQIEAGELHLSDTASLSAISESGEGGNIRVRAGGSLRLRQNATISATAGGTGNGGNIDLSAATIVALENSDITANAIAGRGGNVTIATQGLFGTAFRPVLTPNSDITASSNFGIAGNVRVETPELDTSQNAVVLSTQTLDRDILVRQDCQQLRRGQFAFVGQGGIPGSPAEDFMRAAIPIRRVVASDRMPVSHAPTAIPFGHSGATAIESRGWRQTETGAIVLTGSNRATVPTPQCEAARLPKGGDSRSAS